MASLAESDAGTIAYEAQGSGDPLVLLPGFLSNSEAWSKSGYVDELSAYRLIMIDPLGHGESHKSHQPADYTIDATVSQVVSVLDQENVKTASVVGFSRGGLIAAQLVDRVPERIKAAVFGAVPLGRAVKPVIDEQRVGLEPLQQGDWDSYWATFPVPIPTWMQQHFSDSNDPLALAAALEGMLGWGDEEPELGVKASPVPSMAYFGAGEVFADLLRETLDEAGFPYVERDWAGHAETAMDVSGVSAIINDFLDSAT